MTGTLLTKENFNKEIEESKVTIVDFWAPWCGYCTRIAPSVDQIAEAYQDDIKVVKINIDDEPDLAEQFDVMTIPTLIAFQNGEAVGDPLVAPTAKSQIVGWMQELGITGE